MPWRGDGLAASAATPAADPTPAASMSCRRAAPCAVDPGVKEVASYGVAAVAAAATAYGAVQVRSRAPKHTVSACPACASPKQHQSPAITDTQDWMHAMTATAT